MIGRITRVQLRDVWAHEARDFTTWLEDNVDILNEELGLSLGNVRREQRAGDFNVDLVATDENDRIAVIENQLERSNHDHLGKLITYTSALSARLAIWIVKEPREEHIKAITWLNECSATSFFLVKIEAIQIDDSVPAPLLTLITGPSDESQIAGETKKEIAETPKLLVRFWQSLLNKASHRTELHSNVSPAPRNFLPTGAGLPQGLSFTYFLRQHDSRVELYIDSTKYGSDSNTRIFNYLFSHKKEIEKKFSGKLIWQELPEKRASRIKWETSCGGWRDDHKWDEIQNTLINAMIRFDRALRPFTDKLDEQLR